MEHALHGRTKEQGKSNRILVKVNIPRGMCGKLWNPESGRRMSPNTPPSSISSIEEREEKRKKQISRRRESKRLQIQVMVMLRGIRGIKANADRPINKCLQGSTAKRFGIAVREHHGRLGVRDNKPLCLILIAIVTSVTALLMQVPMPLRGQYLRAMAKARR